MKKPGNRIERFYLNREIGSRILRTIMHLFYCILLFASRYFALFVSICFTVQIKSLSKQQQQQNRSYSEEWPEYILLPTEVCKPENSSYKRRQVSSFQIKSEFRLNTPLDMARMINSKQ